MKRIVLNTIFILAIASLSNHIYAQSSTISKKKLNPIHFDSNKEIPLSSLKSTYKELSTFLDSANSYKIMIIGHTDSVASEEYNLTLSQERAKSVYEYFIQQGLEPTNIRYKGKGESKPIASNKTEKGKALNRRVVVYIKAFFEEKEEVQTSLNVNMQIALEPMQKEIKSIENNLKSQQNFFGYKYYSNDTLLSSLESYTLPKVQKQKLPKDAVKPIEGCRAFFSGLLISDVYNSFWTSQIWKEDMYSEYVGSGSYNNLNEAFPKAIQGTFDGIAIDSNTRIIIYDQPNFKGKIVLNVTGPLVINNLIHKHSLPKLNSDPLKNKELHILFPPENRIWSKTNMYLWQNGSIKIMCKSEVTN